MNLNEIQQKLKAPKSQYNSFGKYHYRNAEDILEAVKPLLGKSVLTLSDEVVQVGNRNYVKATATFIEDRTAAQETGHIVTAYACEAEDRKGMDASQITGAASSYARKYALNGLFLIDDTKDADHDGNEASKHSQTAKTAPQRTKEQETRIEAKKDRILALLKLHEAKHGTKKECEESVMELTSLPLTEYNYEDIITRLADLLEMNEDKN